MDQDLGNLEKLEKLLPALPGGSAGGTPFGGGNGGGGGGQGSVMLSDVMGRDRSINIFAGFTRDVDSIAQRLDDKSKNSTVLAPLNSQIEKLPRKPWEDAQDYDTLGTDAYEGDDGMDRAKKNTRRFVEAHIVPENPWDAGVKTKTLGGETEVWWEEKDGKKVVCRLFVVALPSEQPLTRKQIQPGDIEVVSVASSVANGQVVCTALLLESR